MITIDPRDDPVGYAAAVVREAITCEGPGCSDSPQAHADYADSGLSRATDVINDKDGAQ